MGKTYKNILARMLVYMYAHKGSGRFYNAGITTSSSHNTDTKSGSYAHHATIYSSIKCNKDSVKENGKQRQNYGCEDVCICMPVRVVGGFEKQDLKPVLPMTQTPQLGQILTIAQYTPS